MARNCMTTAGEWRGPGVLDAGGFEQRQVVRERREEQERENNFLGMPGELDVSEVNTL